MSIKPRSPGKTAISVSMSVELLTQLDERAAALGLNRSQYLSQLARADLATGGALTIQESHLPPAVAALNTYDQPTPPTEPVSYKTKKGTKP